MIFHDVPANRIQYEFFTYFSSQSNEKGGNFLFDNTKVTFFLDGQYLPFQNSLRFLDIGVDLFHQSFPSFVDFHYFISVRILFTVFIKIFGFMLIPATV